MVQAPGNISLDMSKKLMLLLNNIYSDKQAKTKIDITHPLCMVTWVYGAKCLVLNGFIFIFTIENIQIINLLKYYLEVSTEWITHAGDFITATKVKVYL